MLGQFLCCRYDAGKRLVDKAPLATPHLPLILKLFPNAKIIFAQRHPCDVILSNFMQCYELDGAMRTFTNIADSVGLYKKVLGLWFLYRKYLEFSHHAVRYESLVEDFEHEIRDLLSFIDVPWSDAVLDYQQRALSKKINTASYQAVTQPIYTSSRYRWRRYAEQLNEVREAVAEEVSVLGYD